MTTLEDLIAVPTEDEKLASLLTDAAGAGFPTTGWQSGSVPRTLLQIESKTLSGLQATDADIAKGGFLDRAEDGWLTLLAKGLFDEDRVAAVRTEGTATLTAAAGAGPYTIVARQLWISDSQDRRFTNTAGGTLSVGGTLDLAWEAEDPGADHNLANGTLTVMVTPLAGVTVANPDPGTGTWITTTGADEESDSELRARCRNKWSTLGTGSTEDSYEFWAKAASNEVRRVLVLEHNNLGADEDGHVTVILAGSSGVVSGDAVTAVGAYIEARRPLCATVHVASAVAKAITVEGTATVLATFRDAAEASIEDNFTAFSAEVEIGGTVYTAAIIEQIMTPAGVVNLALTSPAADTDLEYNEVPAFTLDLDFSEV